MKREFTAVYKKDKNWFLAWVEELPGVNTQGKTLKEAKENLEDALLMMIETNRNIFSVRNTKKEPIFIKIPV